MDKMVTFSCRKRKLVLFRLRQSLYANCSVAPENEALAHAARTAYAYFMELFEDTLINDDLYDFFHEAKFMENFYDVRQVLKWYFFDCDLRGET